MASHQTYSLNAIDPNDINLRSGKVIQNPLPPLIIDKYDSSVLKDTIEDHKKK